MKKKLIKKDIEKLAMEIVAFLSEKGMGNGVCIYYNDKVMKGKIEFTTDEFVNDGLVKLWEVEHGVNPLDYFEWANPDHILSMSFDGSDLYDALNYGYKTADEFQDIFNKYGLYYELGDSWNLSAFPEDDDMEIETTNYERPEQAEHIYLRREDVPKPLKLIMELWHYLSNTVGDKGSCVIGAGFKFRYEGKLYFMSACSPYQGSISWETHKDTVKEMLEGIGATEITYDWGRLD